jgi:hypothetical protein
MAAVNILLRTHAFRVLEYVGTKNKYLLLVLRNETIFFGHVTSIKSIENDNYNRDQFLNHQDIYSSG